MKNIIKSFVAVSFTLLFCSSQPKNSDAFTFKTDLKDTFNSFEKTTISINQNSIHGKLQK